MGQTKHDLGGKGAWRPSDQERSERGGPTRGKACEVERKEGMTAEEWLESGMKAQYGELENEKEVGK